jgi:hypothetical protein
LQRIKFAPKSRCQKRSKQAMRAASIVLPSSTSREGLAEGVTRKRNTDAARSLASACDDKHGHAAELSIGRRTRPGGGSPCAFNRAACQICVIHEGRQVHVGEKLTEMPTCDASLGRFEEFWYFPFRCTAKLQVCVSYCAAELSACLMHCNVQPPTRLISCSASCSARLSASFATHLLRLHRDAAKFAL